MKEREPHKEIIGKGELFFLWHPGTKEVFSGYGLTMQAGSKEFLVGILMVDRPRPADPAWLKAVEEAFGEYELVMMTATEERGIVCQMQIEPDSLPYLRRFPAAKSAAIELALKPLLETIPKPAFTLRWDAAARLWQSQIAPSAELPPEIREVFEQTGYGCMAVEANTGIVHICHAADADIEGFAGKPVRYQWQLILMPTAPLIRLELVILDNPRNPYRFESFLNVAEADQARVLARLAGQDRLYLVFYGDGLGYRFTQAVPQSLQQQQRLDEIAAQAAAYWDALPPKRRDFDRAKAEFMLRYP
ncbi:MAG: hypothetical protein L0332_30840 [Chloroflexi bacterium]|nr:hypothetical protein [Chloroflexota bacterium]MCI0731097.1 hypothetical protein [Chloroflexota bacterium]